MTTNQIVKNNTYTHTHTLPSAATQIVNLGQTPVTNEMKSNYASYGTNITLEKFNEIKVFLVG